jgi:hypothetical protein
LHPLERLALDGRKRNIDYNKLHFSELDMPPIRNAPKVFCSKQVLCDKQATAKGVLAAGSQRSNASSKRKVPQGYSPADGSAGFVLRASG